MRGIILLPIATLVVGCLGLPDEHDPDENWICGNGVVDGNERCDDGNLVSRDGCSASCNVEQSIPISWSLSTASLVPQPCPAGVDTALVVVQPYANVIDCETEICVVAPTGATPHITNVDCAAGQASVFMQTGEFATVRLVDGAGDVYAESLPMQPISANPLHLRIFTDGGYLQLGWKLAGLASQGYLSCTASDISTIQVTATPDAGGGTIDLGFPCYDFGTPLGELSGLALSPVMPAGGYTLAILAYGTGGLGSLPPQHVTIAGANRITDLGVTIPIPGN